MRLRAGIRAVHLTFMFSVLALLARPAAAAETLRVGKAVPFAWTFSALEVGMEAGIFARHGLTIESNGFGGDAKMQQAMAAGSLDLALGGGPGMTFTLKGAPMIAVAAMAGLPKSIGVIVAYGSPYKSMADLKDRKIGVTTVGSLTDWLARRMSILQGWGPNGVKIVTVGGLETSRATLKTGEIDGLMLAIETAYPLETAKEMRILGTTAGFVEDFITHVIYAKNELIEKKPQVVEAFLKGWFETIAFMRANKESTVAITAKTINADPAVISHVYDTEIDMFSADGTFEPKALAVLKQSFIEMGLLKTVPDNTALFTTRFVPVK